MIQRLAGGRDRGDRPRRPRPRRRRRAHRGRRRRGGELRAVDLGPLPERRPDPGRAARASRCSTTCGAELMDRVHEGDVVAHRATASSGATTSCSAAARCSTIAEHRSRDGGRARRPSAPSWSASPRTRSSTSGKEARLTFEPLTLPPLAHEVHADATRWSSCAATTTAPTSPRCARTSASTGRCSSASTAAPTRCSSIGLKPDIIIGDFDSVSEKGLRCGAELVHHVHPDGRAPGSREPRSSGASTTSSSSPRARARTSRCCSRTSRRRS